MMQKLKTYVVTLSMNFPMTHPRRGQSTLFAEKLQNTIHYENRHTEYVGFTPEFKMHTIRANYDLWAKRFEQIEKGEACLSIRQWTGKPYASKQRELCRLTKEDGIGLQMLDLSTTLNGAIANGLVDNKTLVPPNILATNDGLSETSWQDWFEHYDKGSHLAIIHFTPFRY